MKKSLALIIAVLFIFTTNKLQAQNHFDIKNEGDKVVLKLENEKLTYEKSYDCWEEILEDKKLMETLGISGITKENILEELNIEGNLEEGFHFSSEDFSIGYKIKKEKKGISISIQL